MMPSDGKTAKVCDEVAAKVSSMEPAEWVLLATVYRERAGNHHQLIQKVCKQMRTTRA
jgi:hypothetical protein